MSNFVFVCPGCEDSSLDGAGFTIYAPRNVFGVDVGHGIVDTEESEEHLKDLKFYVEALLMEGPDRRRARSAALINLTIFCQNCGEDGLPHKWLRPTGLGGFIYP